MPRVLGSLPRLARACLALGALLAPVGCKSTCKTDKAKGHDCCHNLHIDNCSDIPKGAIPQPVGTFTREYQNRQAIKAEADDFVIYYNEWLDGQAVPTEYGENHIARIAARLPHGPFLVLVQPEPNLPNPGINGDRYAAVVAALTAAGIRDAQNRVVVGRPQAEGLYGEEAETIYPRLISGGGGGFGGGGGGLGGGLGGGFGSGGFGGIGGGFGGIR